MGMRTRYHIQVGKLRGRACQQPAHSLSGVASDALTSILRRENAPVPSALRFPASHGGQTLEPRRYTLDLREKTLLGAYS